MQLGIAGSAYTDLSIDINNQRCINWINISSGPQGKGATDDGNSVKALVPTAGTKKLITLPGEEVRNMIMVRDKVYVTVDDSIYKLTINKLTFEVSHEEIGSINTFGGMVKSAYNPTQIMWTDGDGYIYTDIGFVLPTVTASTPNTGTAAGGTAITITGTGFNINTTVKVGGVNAVITAFTDTTLSVTAPPYANGAVLKDITVNNGYGTVVYSNAFTYTPVVPTITSIIPSTGAPAGNTRVTVTGTNFITGMTANIGGAVITGIEVLSPTSFTGYTTVGVIGTYNTVVSNTAGSASLNSSYSYTAAAIVVSAATINTATVDGLIPITVTGSNMSLATNMSIGDIACTSFSVVNANTVTATIPAYAAGSLTKDVRVTILPSNANNVLINYLTYTALSPTISNISPSNGLSLGKTPITITGTHFTPTTTVTIGGAALTNVEVVNSTTIRGLTPAHDVSAGVYKQDVIVTNEIDSTTLVDGFTYTTGQFREIDDDGFNGANQVVFIDGYFITSKNNSGEIQFSELNDGLSWDPLDIGTAESSPDNIIALGVSKGELWVLGQFSTEIWYNAGNATGAPFSPRVGLELQIGCQAAQSVISLNDLLVWIDNRGYIVQSDVSPYLRNNNSGYNLAIIATDALTEELLNYTNLSDCMAIAYNDRGHLMGQFSFPTDKKTWVFDYLTKQWHERLYYNESDSELQHHLGQFSCSYENLTLVGGIRSGSVYISDYKYLNDDGVKIRRIRTTPFMYLRDDLKFITISQLALRVGQILPIDVNDTPLIGLRYSKDGGHTWSNKLWRDIPGAGKYKNTITWNRLGNARQWLFEFTVSDEVSISLIDCWLNNEVEN